MYEATFFRNLEDFSSKWHDLEDVDGAAEILKWIYGAKVLLCFDNNVTYGEELRFVVAQAVTTDIGNGSGWQGRVVARDIRMQEDVVFLFRLVGTSPRAED